MLKYTIVNASGFSKIAPAAHLVHFGLLLLLVGHVFTTVLVDRGDATHRITLVRGEMVEVDGYGYVFEDIVLENENLEVGDGYVGAIISVYSGEEKIGEVEPGLIRFDGFNHHAAKWIHWFDIMVISCLSLTVPKPTGLMQQVSTDGTILFNACVSSFTTFQVAFGLGRLGPDDGRNGLADCP